MFSQLTVMYRYYHTITIYCVFVPGASHIVNEKYLDFSLRLVAVSDQSDVLTTQRKITRSIPDDTLSCGSETMDRNMPFKFLNDTDPIW